jgi:tRNA-specific 2-thiouridylase
MPKIVVAMSGGVDSSVAAALLAQQGHEVIGLSMQLYDQRGGEIRFGTCCTIDDLHDARRVAARIGIPHYLMNFERQFDDHVVSNFVREYTAGRTPIPCVHCNGDLKFATLVERAAGLGADYVATGHYARIERDPISGRVLLKRGVDASKDQSYFLFTLTQEQLSHAMFPVGELQKTEVRDQARALGLPVAEKHDSHEICFVPDGDQAAFVERYSGGPAPGAITDVAGRVIGRHDGVHRFTVGQRKGLGLSSPIPLYVVGIDAEAATVTVGPREALQRTQLTASGVNWMSGIVPAAGTRVTAQIRYRHREAAATLSPLDDGRAALAFDEPQTAIAPGQAVVFYDGDVVVGGGWID